MSAEHVADFGREPGALKLYIGAAPGVGKTYTMLAEARGLLERGVDVVVGFVDTHGRPDTERQLVGLEVVPPRLVRVGGAEVPEVDLDALVRRRPSVVVIDELAHTNAPGSQFAKRYQDVEYLLDHGLAVLTAVNVHHLEDIHRDAEAITGVPVREVIPAGFVRRASEVVVIDVTPETLRQRLRDGAVFAPSQVQNALTHFFKPENLAGLRELALRVVADDVDERLEHSAARRSIPGPVGAREVILVAVSHPSRASVLLARGQRMAQRMKADFYAVTVADRASGRQREGLARLEALARQYEAKWIVETRRGKKLGAAILAVADRLNVTQIVMGQPARDRRGRAARSHPVHHLLRELTYADLRIVGWQAHENVLTHVRRPPGGGTVEERLPGRLTVYVGAAPGVGKTYRMLQDAHDWQTRGIDVVAGVIDTHGREDTRREIGSLPIIPSMHIRVGDDWYEALDVEAIIRRRPARVLVDELAHSNPPDSARGERYEDIVHLLTQGIDVVTTVDIQHLESLHDKVAHITGVSVRERVPDWFMKLADEWKLVDVSPETLQQRWADGRIYPGGQIAHASPNLFQTASLAALRELALLEVADNVDLRRRHPLGDNPERVLVCVNHRPHSERLIRRGWRLADRLQGELWVLAVLSHASLSSSDARDLERIRALSARLDARFETRRADARRIGETIAGTAQELGVTQLVVGQPMRPRSIRARLSTNPIEYVLSHVDFVDLHVVAHTAP